MLPPDLLEHVRPTWVPYVPDASTDLHTTLTNAIESYLHFLPHPCKPVEQPMESITECLSVLGVVPESPRHAKDMYLNLVPGLALLFDRDVEVAALYAALLIKDFDKARHVTSVSKDKVLLFLDSATPLEALRNSIRDRYSLPVVEHGIPLEYWKHMNVFDRDHEDILSKIKAIHDQTHYALSYLLDHCEISMGHTLQIGFKL